MAKIKHNVFYLGDGMTLEIIPPDGDCYPFGAVCFFQPHTDDVIIAPCRYETAVDAAVAFRVVSRFFDRRAKAGSAGCV